MARSKKKPAKAKPKAKAKAKAKAKPKAKARANAKPKAKAKATANARAKTSAKAKPKAKPKTTAKPSAVAPAAGSTSAPTSGDVHAALEMLRAWAANGGGTLDETPAVDDAQDRLLAPAPEWGTVTWQLPPSYRALLSEVSRLAIKWGENIGHDEFVILDPAEMAETGGIVYMPDDVSRDPGKYLSTNHLVPFASAGNDECAFCFDVTVPDAAGEYPVYFHHQDEPRARYKDGGEWEEPENATPDFPTFASWLTWVATELTAGAEFPHSYPSAFHAMPGRRGAD